MINRTLNFTISKFNLEKMIYISFLTDVQNVRFVGQRIQQRFLRGGNRFRGERRFQKSRGEREPTPRIFVHSQRLEFKK